jgi:methylase of polypeptide subunit release factors
VTLPRFGAQAAARAARALRPAIARAAFDAEAVMDLLGPPDARLLPAEQQALWSHRARGRDPLAVFTRLFLLGDPVTRADAAALWGDALGTALAARVVRRQGRALTASLALSVHDGLLTFADRVRPAPGLVHGPTSASLVLARALPPGPLGAALDLGTGSGLLALRLVRVARRVTATDVSPRALAYAALNAALNGRPGIELLRSDRYAALGRRRFALVAGNLPFVVGPVGRGRRYSYRDAGMQEDRFAASVVSGAGAHLEEGGQALFLAQWVHHAGEAEDERLARWFVAAGCDALVFRLDVDPVDIHAARWSGGPDPALAHGDRVRALERWRRQLTAAGIAAVSTGLFVLRRRQARRHLMSIDDAADAPDWQAIAARWADVDGGGRRLAQPRSRGTPTARAKAS